MLKRYEEGTRRWKTWNGASAVLSLATFVDDLYRSCPPPAISASTSTDLSRHLTQHGRKEPRKCPRLL